MNLKKIIQPKILAIITIISMLIPILFTKDLSIGILISDNIIIIIYLIIILFDKSIDKNILNKVLTVGLSIAFIWLIRISILNHQLDLFAILFYIIVLFMLIEICLKQELPYKFVISICIGLLTIQIFDYLLYTQHGFLGSGLLIYENNIILKSFSYIGWSLFLIFMSQYGETFKCRECSKCNKLSFNSYNILTIIVMVIFGILMIAGSYSVFLNNDTKETKKEVMESLEDIKNNFDEEIDNILEGKTDVTELTNIKTQNEEAIKKAKIDLEDYLTTINENEIDSSTFDTINTYLDIIVDSTKVIGEASVAIVKITVDELKEEGRTSQESNDSVIEATKLMTENQNDNAEAYKSEVMELESKLKNGKLSLEQFNEEQKKLADKYEI